MVLFILHLWSIWIPRHRAGYSYLYNPFRLPGITLPPETPVLNYILCMLAVLCAGFKTSYIRRFGGTTSICFSYSKLNSLGPHPPLALPYSTTVLCPPTYSTPLPWPHLVSVVASQPHFTSLPWLIPCSDLRRLRTPSAASNAGAECKESDQRATGARCTLQ